MWKSVCWSKLCGKVCSRVGRMVECVCVWKTGQWWTMSCGGVG